MSITIYLIQMIFASVTAGIYQSIKNKNSKFISKIFLLMSFLSVFIISAIRFGIGTDYFMYKSIYLTAASGVGPEQLSKLYQVEPGWATLNYLLGLVFKNGQTIFIVVALISTICVYKGIIYFDKRINTGFAIFVYLIILYLPSFNILRQGFALSILMISFKYIEEKKIVKFILILALAMSFHYTAILFLPVYYILNKDIGKVKWIIILACVILVFINYNDLINLIIGLGPYFEKYSKYETQGFIKINKTFLILQIIMLMFIAVCNKALKQKDKFMHRMLSMYYISIILSFLGSLVSFAGRADLYFSISQIIFLPYMCKNLFKEKNKIVAYVVIIIYLLIFWYICYYYSGNNQCFPYKTIF